MQKQKLQQQQPQQSKEKRDKNLVICLLLLAILLGVFLGHKGFQLWGDRGGNDTPTPDNNSISFEADGNAEQGDITGKSNDEIVAALNQKVQEGMINISMNTNPVFENGKAKGTLMITNSNVNRYPQQVEIYTKADNQLIYSGGLNVGDKIETSTLSVDLPKGTYDCVAYFNAIDPSTGYRIGTAGANITITILA